jgi:hypothetical protein
MDYAAPMSVEAERESIPYQKKSLPPAAAPSDPMLALIELQEFQGSWSEVKKVQDASGVVVECPSELSGRPDVFATALAIAILRKHFQSRESQWRMIERKAQKWLSTQGVDAEGVIAQLMDLC